MTDPVEVLDVEILTTTPGLKINHTIRPHEGDGFEEGGKEEGAIRIQFGPVEQLVGNEKRRIVGPRVTIQSMHVVQMTIAHRFEPRVRQSVKMQLDRDAAELERLRKEHGVADPGNS